MIRLTLTSPQNMARRMVHEVYLHNRVCVRNLWGRVPGWMMEKTMAEYLRILNVNIGSTNHITS